MKKRYNQKTMEEMNTVIRRRVIQGRCMNCGENMGKIGYCSLECTNDMDWCLRPSEEEEKSQIGMVK